MLENSAFERRAHNSTISIPFLFHFYPHLVPWNSSFSTLQVTNQELVENSTRGADASRSQVAAFFSEPMDNWVFWLMEGMEEDGIDMESQIGNSSIRY